MIGVFQLPTTASSIRDLIIGLIVWALMETIGNTIMDRTLGRIMPGYIGAVPYGSTYKHVFEHILDFGKTRAYTYAVYSSFVAGIMEEIMWFGAPMFVGLNATNNNLFLTIALMTVSMFVWASVHASNYFDNARVIGKYNIRWKAFWGAMGYYVPAGASSMVLWLLGFGYVSMILHTAYDLSITLKEAKYMRLRARLHREYMHKGRKRVNPYAGESFVPDNEEVYKNKPEF